MTKKSFITLPTEIQKGSIVSVEVNIKGQSAAKAGLKVTNLNRKTVTVMEVDRGNKKNIFRKFLLTDIVGLGQTTESQFILRLREGVLPRKEESSWDSIGKGGYQRRQYSYRSSGWSRSSQFSHALGFLYAPEGSPIPVTNAHVVIVKQ